ncbi:MAG: ABC transporter permease, partial [Planctomycetota bacterium]
NPRASEREVIIGPRVAIEHGVEVGDEVLLSRPHRPVTKRCEDGVLVSVRDSAPDQPRSERFRVVGVLNREGVGRTGAGNVVVVDFDVGRDLYRGVPIQPRFWAAKDPSVDLERLRRSLAAAYSYSLNQGIVVGQAADERAFRTGVRMLGLLALVLGLYVIFHTLSMSLTERVQEVGTLHALGAMRRQIGRVFFTEAVVLAGAGALVGVGLGLAFAFAAVQLGITTLGVGKYVQGFAVPWTTVGGLALTGFFVALVGSVYPLVAIGGTNTLAALRGEEALQRNRAHARRFHLVYAGLLALLVPGLYVTLVPVVGQLTGELVTVLLGVVGLLTLVVLLSLLLPVTLTALCAAIARPLAGVAPLAGRLAVRSMRDAPARVGVSACALGLVSAGFVGLHGMTQSLRGEVTNWADEAVDDKVWVRDLPPTDYQVLRKHLESYPGIVGVEKGTARQYAPFLVLAGAREGLTGHGPLADDLDLARRFQEERTVVVSRRLARDLDYAVGDTVQMKSATGDVLGYTVLAVTDAYGYWTSPDERMYGVIADRWMEKDFCVASDVVTEVSVRFDRSRPMTDEGHVGVLDAAVRDLMPEAEAYRFRRGIDIRNYALRDIGRDFFVFDLLLGLMAGLAALGVLNGMLLATLERMRELGVLRALGASRKQVGRSLMIEAVTVGVVGGGLGVLLGVAATPFVVSALDVIAGLDLPRVTAGVWIPLSFGGTVLVAALAALYPIRRAHAVDAVRAVRTR